MRSLRDVLLLLTVMGTVVPARAQENIPEIARQGLAEANRLRESGKAKEAVERYREVLSLAPSLVEAYVGLGAVYHQLEDFQSAISTFEAGLAQAPDDPTLLFNAAATEVKLERFEEALGFADRAIKSGAEDPALHTLRGTVLRKLGRQEEAVQAFRKAAELDSKSARAQYNLGNVYYELGRKEEALDSYQKAVKLDKDFQPAHYNMGTVLFDLERFDEALKAYEVALEPVEKDFEKGKEVSPAHARAYLNLGAIYLKRQSWDRALDAYGKAARLDPSLAAAHYNVGYIQYRLGNPVESYRAYERAMKLDPQLPLSYLHMGLIDFGAGRTESAVRLLARGLPMFTGDDRKEALLALGPSYVALGDLANAEASYRAALELQPSEVGALVGLGRILRQQGKLTEARDLLERAGEVVLDGAGVALELAALARAEGDGARERAMYEQALRKDGNRPEMWPVRTNLVAAMVRGGDVASALDQMEILLKQLPLIRESSPEVAMELRTAHALLVARNGDREGARRELAAVLKDDSAFVPAANASAALLAVTGKLSEASSSWAALASRAAGTPIDALIRANLGTALWLQGRLDEAREPLLAAAEQFPDNPLLRTALGEIALGRGDTAGALRELRAAAEVCGTSKSASTPKEPSTRLELFLSGDDDSNLACARARSSYGVALVQAAGEKLTDPGSRREVGKMTEEAIGLGIEGKPLAQALFLRGTVALFEGADQKAQSDLSKALRGGLSEDVLGAAHNNLGVALYRSGAIAEAERQFEQARQASVETPPAVLNLAILHHDAKDSEKALVLYDEYLALGGKRGEDARAWADGIRRLYR